MPTNVQAAGRTRIPTGFTIAQLVAASGISDAESELSAVLREVPRHLALAVEDAAMTLSFAWVQFLSSRHKFSAESAINAYENARGAK